MRRSLVTTAATLALFLGTSNIPMASARAGSATTQSAASGGKLEKLKSALEQLNLTVAQKSKIKEIMTSAKTSLASAKTSATAGTSDRSKVKEIVAGMMKKIEAVLTAEQTTKLKSLMGSKKAL